MLDSKFDKKLATTIFLQVDGGYENRYFPLLGELLVARGLCETFVMTRLPVGHTHEDVDSRFGTLWKASRGSHLLTPNDYSKLLRKAFARKQKQQVAQESDDEEHNAKRKREKAAMGDKKKKPPEVFRTFDIFVLPNYEAILDSMKDPAFSHH